jgi:hypothetical protein
LASISNENHTFDFSGIMGDLNASEIEELYDLSPEEIMELLGLTEERMKILYGDDFTKEDLS